MSMGIKTCMKVRICAEAMDEVEAMKALIKLIVYNKDK